MSDNDVQQPQRKRSKSDVGLSAPSIRVTDKDNNTRVAFDPNFNINTLSPTLDTNNLHTHYIPSPVSPRKRKFSDNDKQFTDVQPISIPITLSTATPTSPTNLEQTTTLLSSDSNYRADDDMSDEDAIRRNERSRSLSPNALQKDGAPLEKKKRKQVKRACQNCNTAHAACDYQRPCTRCVRLNLQSTCIDMVRKNSREAKENARNKRQGQQLPVILPLLPTDNLSPYRSASNNSSPLSVSPRSPTSSVGSLSPRSPYSSDYESSVSPTMFDQLSLTGNSTNPIPSGNNSINLVHNANSGINVKLPSPVTQQNPQFTQIMQSHQRSSSGVAPTITITSKHQQIPQRRHSAPMYAQPLPQHQLGNGFMAPPHQHYMHADSYDQAAPPLTLSPQQLLLNFQQFQQEQHPQQSQVFSPQQPQLQNNFLLQNTAPFDNQQQQQPIAKTTLIIPRGYNQTNAQQNNVQQISMPMDLLQQQELLLQQQKQQKEALLLQQQKQQQELLLHQQKQQQLLQQQILAQRRLQDVNQMFQQQQPNQQQLGLVQNLYISNQNKITSASPPSLATSPTTAFAQYNTFQPKTQRVVPNIQQQQQQFSQMLSQQQYQNTAYPVNNVFQHIGISARPIYENVQQNTIKSEDNSVDSPFLSQILGDELISTPANSNRPSSSVFDPNQVQQNQVFSQNNNNELISARTEANLLAFVDQLNSTNNDGGLLDDSQFGENSL
jgi:hypothetical protein